MVRKPCPKSKKKTNSASCAPFSDSEDDLHPSPQLLRPLSCRSTSLADLTSDMPSTSAAAAAKMMQAPSSALSTKPSLSPLATMVTRASAAAARAAIPAAAKATAPTRVAAAAANRPPAATAPTTDSAARVAAHAAQRPPVSAGALAAPVQSQPTLHEILKEQRKKLEMERKATAKLMAEFEARHKKRTTTLGSSIIKATAKKSKRTAIPKEKPVSSQRTRERR
ncbi:GL10065 [Drosophila persimilis]|uniref:GL10065 n=1 Tax=Drosophila persimilis TaxID=7234 RepID=B4HDA3_DROPE|nr:GL10065 [Drosophila persimilis]